MIVLERDYEAEFQRNKKEYLACISDLISSEIVQSMAQYVQHGSCTTLDHCICVSYLSYLYAKDHGADYRACARGGLLHDMCLYDWHLTKPPTGGLHGYVHPIIAANIAKKYFSLSDKEYGIIYSHMWPLTMAAPTSREAMIVSLTDKKCALMETLRYNYFERRYIIKSVLDCAKKLIEKRKIHTAAD